MDALTTLLLLHHGAGEANPPIRAALTVSAIPPWRRPRPRSSRLGWPSMPGAAAAADFYSDWTFCMPVSGLEPDHGGSGTSDSKNHSRTQTQQSAGSGV